MRKTTTSLAIFCSAVAIISTSAGCGKRGDPLPPLRPFPDSAEGLTIRQIGNRIKLEWRAPTRNTDGTVEKLELAEVEVRRRIIDIAALVEAQTEMIEPPEPEPKPEEDAETEDLETEEPETEPDERPVTEPSEPSPASAAGRSGMTIVATGSIWTVVVRCPRRLPRLIYTTAYSRRFPIQVGSTSSSNVTVSPGSVDSSVTT